MLQEYDFATSLQFMSPLWEAQNPPEPIPNPEPKPNDIPANAPRDKGKGRQAQTPNPEGVGPLSRDPNDPNGNKNPSEGAISPLSKDGGELFRQVLTTLATHWPMETQAKVWELNTDDGTDQAKLQTFLSQCLLNFRDHPKACPTGASEIRYAISYLSDLAHQYFDPVILGKIVPEPA